MKKLATLLAIGAVAWGVGLAGRAAAGADPQGNNPWGNNWHPQPPVNTRAFVSFQCRIFSGQGGTERIFGIDAAGSLPGACTVGSTCGGCAAALLGDGYTLDKAFGVTQANSGYAGPYFVFIK